MSVSEVACSYAALILHADGIPITAEKISALLQAANVSVESYWPRLFAQLAEKKDLEDLMLNAGSGGVAAPAPAAAAPAAAAASAAAPAAEEKKKDEPEEESDGDIGGLFGEDD